ncbi:MAG: rhamnan synthesis F family protein [Pseudomonadota bacterium]
MKRLGIFTTLGSTATQIDADYVIEALKGFRSAFDYLVVVTDITQEADYYDQVNDIADHLVRTGLRRIGAAVEGHKAAIASIGQENLESYDEVVLFDAANFGPVCDVEAMFADMAVRECDFWSINHTKPQMDPRIADRFTAKVLPKLDFVAFRKTCISHPAFAGFWANVTARENYFENLVETEMTFFQTLIDEGLNARYYIDPAKMKTADPAIMEIIAMLEAGAPLVSKNSFVLDPIVTEMQALNGRQVMDWLDAHTNYDTQLIWDSLIDKFPLRTIHTNLEEVRVIEDRPVAMEKTEWSFGKVAVFAHVFYAEMTDEFIERVKLIPGEVDFFATTASLEHRLEIERRVRELGFEGKIDIREVEQNRGRDMSSLFITFRDVVLGGEYGLCLRLHSKRTPQMSAQIGASFKDHMFDNLVPSTGYVSRLFDIIDANPNIGVVIPPTVHIGYGTLGHSWFANRKAFNKLAVEMGLTVPFDAHTPVAAYGTMYWFRPQALRRMFERKWKWEEFNPEPHHVDGGLAHVQERLICYTAQQDKFRTLSVMNPRAASRNYVKLEYKHQLLASFYPTGDIRRMIQIAGGESTARLPAFSRARFFAWVAEAYDSSRETWPWFWRVTQPISKWVWPKMQRVIERSRA